MFHEDQLQDQWVLVLLIINYVNYWSIEVNIIHGGLWKKLGHDSNGTLAFKWSMNY